VRRVRPVAFPISATVRTDMARTSATCAAPRSAAVCLSPDLPETHRRAFAASRPVAVRPFRVSRFLAARGAPRDVSKVSARRQATAAPVVRPDLSPDIRRVRPVAFPISATVRNRQGREPRQPRRRTFAASICRALSFFVSQSSVVTFDVGRLLFVCRSEPTPGGRSVLSPRRFG